MTDRELEASKIGLRIKLARVAKGWSQAKLAESLGINRVTVTKYENGSITPPIKTLRKIAEVLDKNVADIVIDEEDFSARERSLIESEQAMSAKVNYELIKLQEAKGAIQQENVDDATIDRAIKVLHQGSSSEDKRIVSCIEVGDLTSSEISELLMFKSYLIFRRQNNEQE